ncbi:hypothetical protein ACIQNI_32655 [Streptomyces sp. NPDC091266]|uniref:hypothetical protein n=1 Tax=Streptomyces sp. NPDC091266 TaxID=3365978 RepID=UPI0037F6DF72
MRYKAGAVFAIAASAVAAGILAAPAASADVSPKAVEYVCTSKHSGNTASAKCANLARIDRYRVKVTCIDSRGVQSNTYGPWKNGVSGDWSTKSCPGAGYFYKAGYQVELG